MALNERQTPLMASNNAVYKTVDGVTYFKLKSNFDGDYTKHCGLLGEEIDKNFYFLRGYDIESVTLDENRRLIIERVDKSYGSIIVDISEEIEHPTFEYDKSKGTITVKYPNGDVKVMDGFLIEGIDVRIATDCTMKGNGTIFNPMRVSPVETTGTFAPADEYFDLTSPDMLNQMPEGKGRGYRIVTKEKIDNFGCLYPFSAVKKIQKALEENCSQWRVPTKDDWDELLNAFECAEFRNHNSVVCSWLGESAGRALKSVEFWDNFENSPLEKPTFGEDVAGISIYPVGITPDRNEVLNDRDYDVEGFGKIAGLWANTETDEQNAYVKLFGFNSGKVDQDTYGEGARMSIRLCKEYTLNNYHEIETILGFPYPTEIVYGPYEDDMPYVKIWTKVNFYSDAENLGGIRSDEWSAVTDSDRGIEIVYFINEWTGTEWHKKPMENGDSIVIVNKEEKPYHEWRIIEGELIDTTDALAEEFNKDFAEVRKNINILSEKTGELVAFSGWVVETVNEFSAATVSEVARLDADVTAVSATTTAFSAATVSAIERLDGNVTTVSATTTAFSAATVNEIARLDADVTAVSATTTAFSAATVNEIARLDADVTAVSATTTAFSASTVENIKRIDSVLNEEINARIANDITPGTYTLNGDASVEMVIPTNSEEVQDIKVKVSNNFFDFGTFEDNE